VKHVEYVREITSEPNYDAALGAAKQAAGAYHPAERRFGGFRRVAGSDRILAVLRASFYPAGRPVSR
jgi:hypothetical protein